MARTDCIGDGNSVSEAYIEELSLRLQSWLMKQWPLFPFVVGSNETGAFQTRPYLCACLFGTRRRFGNSVKWGHCEGGIGRLFLPSPRWKSSLLTIKGVRTIFPKYSYGRHSLRRLLSYLAYLFMVYLLFACFLRTRIFGIRSATALCLELFTSGSKQASILSL